MIEKWEEWVDLHDWLDECKKYFWSQLNSIRKVLWIFGEKKSTNK